MKKGVFRNTKSKKHDFGVTMSERETYEEFVARGGQPQQIPLGVQTLDMADDVAFEGTMNYTISPHMIADA